MDLVPIKVKIGLRANGHADHPNWNLLPLANSVDPSTHMFHGWKYDKTSGHAEHTADSPLGQQWGVVLVTKQFAKEALEVFPELITVLTEVQLEDFWNNKVHAHLTDNNVNVDALNALKLEKDLLDAINADTTAIKAKITKALNPNDITPGLKVNKQKTWTTAKTQLDITITDIKK